MSAIPQSIQDELYMAMALELGQHYLGATAPNPPVGAIIVKDGQIIGAGAHQRAGTDHAEICAIKDAWNRFGSQSTLGATIYVTLEPCNHQGRTPPCTQALINAGIKTVVAGVKDPNPRVKGGGAKLLADAGITYRTGILESQCHQLIAAFSKHIATGLPYLVHKMAWRQTKAGELTMIPPEGQTTFTAPHSLEVAHWERRWSDAIITGIGTVLADRPQFTVRAIADHPKKSRKIAVIGQSHRFENLEVWKQWHSDRMKQGFEILVFDDLTVALEELGHQNVSRALLEAGPKLSSLAEKSKLWDKRLMIFSRENQKDIILENYVHRNY